MTFAETLPTLDPSLLVALAALVFSLVSPILSTLISGLIRIKEKRMDAKAEEERRRHDFVDRRSAEIISKYLSAAGAACKQSDTDTRTDFGSVMSEIYLYADQTLWPVIDQINAGLSSRPDARSAERPDIEAKLTELAKGLSRQCGYHHKDPDHANK